MDCKGLYGGLKGEVEEERLQGLQGRGFIALHDRISLELQTGCYADVGRGAGRWRWGDGGSRGRGPKGAGVGVNRAAQAHAPCFIWQPAPPRKRYFYTIGTYNRRLVRAC